MQKECIVVLRSARKQQGMPRDMKIEKLKGLCGGHLLSRRRRGGEPDTLAWHYKVTHLRAEAESPRQSLFSVTERLGDEISFQEKNRHEREKKHTRSLRRWSRGCCAMRIDSSFYFIFSIFYSPNSRSLGLKPASGPKGAATRAKHAFVRLFSRVTMNIITKRLDPPTGELRSPPLNIFFSLFGGVSLPPACTYGRVKFPKTASSSKSTIIFSIFQSAPLFPVNFENRKIIVPEDRSTYFHNYFIIFK